MNNAQTAAEHAQQSAQESASELASQQSMVGTAKQRVELIEEQLHAARYLFIKIFCVLNLGDKIILKWKY